MESQIHEMPTLFERQNLNFYLKAYLRIFKSYFGAEQVKAWSLKLGVTSRITFKHLLSGKRDLNYQQKSNLENLLDLSQKEKDFLVSKVNSSSTPKAFIAPPDFFATPLNTIILNLCGLKTGMAEHEVKAILSPAFSEEEIVSSTNTLLKLNLVAPAKNQRLHRIFKGNITTLPGVKSNASEKYFQKVNVLSQQAWHLPLTMREFNSFTFRIKQQDFAKAKDLVRDFRKEITRLSADEDQDTVYQASICLFPIYTQNRSPETTK